MPPSLPHRGWKIWSKFVGADNVFKEGGIPAPKLEPQISWSRIFKAIYELHPLHRVILELC